MDLTVVVDPVGQQGQDGVGVWEDDGRGVVPFQCFDEGLGHAVALWTSNGGKEQIDAEGSGEGSLERRAPIYEARVGEC